MKLKEVEKLWSQVPESEHINIYINTPFCYCHCRYCLYQGNKYREEQVNNYYEYYLLPNLKETLKTIENRVVDTVYFGGGTPNCMPVPVLKEIIAILGDKFSLAKARIIEINPFFVTDDFLDAVIQAGFTLVTLGAQTFDYKSLIEIKRLPVTYQRITEVIERLRDGGVKYISIDLMAFVQTYRINDLYDYLLDDLQKGFALDIDFITLYPELNLINIDKEADKAFKSFIVNVNNDNYYRECDDFSENPRSIVRYIRKKHKYEDFLGKILPYYEDDFPYATMNIIGIGDYHSKQEVLSYSPKRFAYVEEYHINGPQYRLLYSKYNEEW